ncbi:MAG: NTP transferase domain-containing protein [Ruminococcus sp.]|nr:NTP transferase domain-containing protein [Ruminococcus sp.]
MTYIFLVAGKGSRLHPLTLKYPKSLYKLDKNTTVLTRMVNLIKKYDKGARIVIVTGFMCHTIQKEMQDVTFVSNPFYEVTNSIASLWFARQYLDAKNVVLINGDIVMDEDLVKNIICKETQIPKVCIDSSIKSDGDYNVQVNGNKVLVMSKDLDQYYGEYAGVTKLDNESAIKLHQCICNMVENGMYDQWYENALVQMIFNEDFQLYYEDIRDYRWTEIDCVSDMLLAKQIHVGMH